MCWLEDRSPEGGVMGRTTHWCMRWVLQESPCLDSGKAGSCPGEERPRQRNVCGDRDGFEQGLWSGQENTGNWLQLKVLLPGDCSRDGKIDKRCVMEGPDSTR